MPARMLKVCVIVAGTAKNDNPLISPILRLITIMRMKWEGPIILIMAVRLEQL